VAAGDDRAIGPHQGSADGNASFIAAVEGLFIGGIQGEPVASGLVHSASVFAVAPGVLVSTRKKWPGSACMEGRPLRASVMESVRVLAAAICLLGGLFCGGCFAPAAIVATAGLSAFEAGSTAFIRGELEYATKVPIESVFRASQLAMREMQFEILGERLGDQEATVRGKELGGRGIRIDLERKSPVVTKVNIRVGVFGDQSVSQLIQQVIQARVEHLDPEDVPPIQPLRRRPEPYFPE
jgi:hypothetical protein